MSKIRNSLGVLVLPVPEEEMTWEEYKKKYGVNLRDIVEVYNSGTSSRLITTKVLYVQDFHGVASGFEFPQMAVTGFASEVQDETSIGGIILTGLLYDSDEHKMLPSGGVTIFPDKIEPFIF